jgi:hypothetical protein
VTARMLCLYGFRQQAPRRFIDEVVIPAVTELGIGMVLSRGSDDPKSDNYWPCYSSDAPTPQIS